MENGKNSPQSELKNYIRLQYLLNATATSVLRRQFSEKWRAVHLSEWENTSDNGEKFIQGAGKSIHKHARSIQKKMLESGDITKWDLPLLVTALECFSNKKKSAFESLIKIRNQLAHQGSMVIEDNEFEKMWNEACVVLLVHGVSQEEIDLAKKIGVEDQNAENENQLNKANMARAEELKNNGNELFKRKKFVPAIFMYSEAIILPEISSNVIAVLYSNRSVAFLELGDFDSAKEDAKAAVHHRPSWWKGYYRLASSYKALQKYEQALKYFDISLVLEPANAQIKDDRDHCRDLIAKRERDQHLDPMYFETTFEDTVRRMGGQGHGVHRKARQLELMQKFASGHGLLLGICGDGHNYRYGRGVKQDYAIAATHYAKAARQGSAEGLYNLAMMTKEGLGVLRNMSEAVSLCRQAASQDPTMDLFGLTLPNVGVMEAEHSLGLAYQEGVGVPRNYKMALEWYEKGIQHGSGPSANNAALMYAAGDGVMPSAEKAVEYWKIGAALKTVRCMENLAHHYVEVQDLENARNWYSFALQKGSVRLKIEAQDKFKIQAEEHEKNPVESDIFELELLEAVRTGPLKHLFQANPVSKLEQKMLKLDEALLGSRQFGKASARAAHGLSDPYRIHIIKEHRQSIHNMKKSVEKLRYEASPAPLKPVPVDLIGLKPIHFEDMTAEDDDHIYEGFVLKLTLIEDADVGRPSIALIGEDDKGDVQRIYVYNFKQDKTTQDSLGFGCRISIVNPYYRIMIDEMPGIRVDDTSMLFLHPHLTDRKRCRYCGEQDGNGTVACRTCKRVFYCSKLCLKQDSSQLDHELVCKKHL